MPNHKPAGLKRSSAGQENRTNEQTLKERNLKNGVVDEQRQEIIQILRNSGNMALIKLMDQYFASMNQDRNPVWLAQKPPKPEFVCGTIPDTIHETFDILGIGGMFAYLNVTYQAHKHGGKHCIITYPWDIFTFSGWTLHPEEDMDQRLIEMFQTKSLFINEVKRILRLADLPETLRFKAFRISYSDMVKLFREHLDQLTKNIRVALQYAMLELTDRDKRYARMNLERNASTLRALEEMGCIGGDPGKHLINMCGRVVYEVSQEAKIESKAALKREYGLLGEDLSPDEIKSIYGAELKILQDISADRIHPVRYPGGHFLLGYKDTALKLAREKKVSVYEDAVVTKITVDRNMGKFAVNMRNTANEEKTIVTNVLLAAFGDYPEDIITVDGISTLFVITTSNANYRIHPTGMGEGGTIHIVPVWADQSKRNGKILYHHLGKATNGAIMGRNPTDYKSLEHDKAFLAHLEKHLKRIVPPDSVFIWLAATECGRPVSARQGYSIKPLRMPNGCGESAQTGLPLSFVASGGCGLGGNTAIIPEVQQALDRRRAESKRERSS